MRHLLIAALLAACGPVRAAEILPGPYPADILRVIDGDTVEARVHVWLGLDQTIRIRLRGIDAPELRGPCRAAAEAARDHLAGLLRGGPVTVFDISHDKYGGRVDARLILPDGRDVAAVVLQSGHAHPMELERPVSCSQEKHP